MLSFFGFQMGQPWLGSCFCGKKNNMIWREEIGEKKLENFEKILRKKDARSNRRLAISSGVSCWGCCYFCADFFSGEISMIFWGIFDVFMQI